MLPTDGQSGQSGREGEGDGRQHVLPFFSNGNVRLACVVTAGALAILFYPFPPPIAGKLIDGVDKVAHVILFGAMAWAWRRVAGEGWRRQCAVGVALSGLALAVELIQPLTGRSCEVLDWVAGTTGVIVGTVFPLGAWWKLAGMGLALGLCGGAFLLPSAWAVRAERAAWPWLVDGTRLWAEWRWMKNGMEVSRLDGEGLRLEKTPEEERWPGIFRRPANSDWSRMGDLELRWTWGGDVPGQVGIRIDPELHEHREPSYAERFELDVQSVPGMNRLVIPSEKWRRRGDGTLWETKEVRQWGFFLVDAPGFEYVVLHEVRFLNEEDAVP